MLNIVATPIGNLDDLSIRQAKTLMASDIILAEDTRNATVLLDAVRTRFSHLDFSNKVPKIISYYKEKEFEKLPQVIEWLKEDKNISLISESGVPLISDPGYLLVKTVIKEQIPFTVIPGATAISTAIVHSGFDAREFTFLGFLSKKESEKIKLIKKLRTIKELLPDMIFVFFESGQRINDTLKLFVSSDFNADLAICRELTKKFEEIIRGKANELVDKHFKGEITVVVR